MENENIQPHNITNQILEKIKSGEVNMKPKYYFMLKLIALGVTIFLTSIFSTILVSYVLFSIKVSGQFFLLGFGIKGFYHFFMALPWLILILDMLLIVFLDWLLKGFRFGYNSPILMLFVFTLVAITILASLLNFTSFHNSLMQRAERKNLPLAGSFYDGLRKSHGSQGTFRGKIISIESTTTFSMMHNDFDMNDEDNNTVEVFVPDTVNMYAMSLVPGDQVFIAGERIPTGIQAYGIHKLTAEQ